MKLVRLMKMYLNENYSRVQVSKHLSDMFPIKSGLKQGDAFLPLVFNSALEYAIRMVHVNHRMALNEVIHSSFWFMLMMLVYWAEALIL